MYIIASCYYDYFAWDNVLKSNIINQKVESNLFGYAGYMYDKESEMYYLIARYYDPEHGVFLSVDPDPGDEDDPVTQNGYTYANNNPVNMVDPDGHKAFRKTVRKQEWKTMENVYWMENLCRVKPNEQKDLLKLFVGKDEVLCFFYVECNLKYANEEKRNLVTNNFYEKSQEWIIPLEQIKEIKGMMWYKAETDEDIFKAIESDSLYRCIVVKKGLPVTNFTYSFALIETEDDDGGMIDELVIMEKGENKFLNIIAPKIREMFGNRLKIS